MKRLSPNFIFLLFFILFPLPVLSQEKIPIVAWWLTPNKNFPKDKKIKDIKDCGFNTILYYDEGVPSADSVCKLAAQCDLEIILGSYKLKSDKAQSYINALSGCKNIVAWYLKDEPLFKDLPALKREYDNLSIYARQKPIYINLIGCRSDKYTGPCPTMGGEYLDTIEKLFHPQIWSFDYYPVSVDKGKIKVQYNQFFKSLKAFHDKSVQTGMPFWSFCETVEYKRQEIERPAATLPFLRFEAFSALAFGAKGIVYWSYELTKSKKGDFISALIDSTGMKTPAWSNAQQVNREISTFGDIFINANVNRIYIPNKGLLSSQLNEHFCLPI
ncbi:MAG: beta-galactosidase, partial [Muribaculaceae bacterium]|nr:beta-galactosidase [Muribaculaceae bacterium]